LIKLRRKVQPALSNEIGFFKIRKGQVVLGVCMVFGIFSLGSWSVYSAQPHQVEKISILSEANDASSLAYSQRESFNTAIELERWMHGEAEIRELQITRALLGQRLQVRLGSGQSTYDLMSDKYRWALAEIDKIIIGGKNIPANKRYETVKNKDLALNTFLTETRRMSSDMARLSIKQVSSVVQKRARVEFWQAIITFVTALFGVAFFLWLLRDVTNRFNTSRNILLEEQQKVHIVMNTLSLVRDLDSLQNSILNRPVDSWGENEFIDLLNYEVAKLAPTAGLWVEVVDRKLEIIAVRARHAQEIDEYELNLIQKRLQETGSIHGSRRRLFSESNYRANHDHITGLLNAAGLRSSIDKLPHNHLNIAAIFFDIDRFHRINDAMGFKYGDSILQKVAEKLSAHALPGDLVARISSDEYVLLTPIHDVDEARFKALEIQSDVEFVASNQDIDIEITVSVAVLVTEAAKLSADSILHDGAIAANIAGRQTRAGFALYNEFEGKELVDALAEEFALKQAIKNNEFELFMQPIVNLESEEVVGAETLIRWRRPGHGLVFPDEFLPKMREFNLMEELGKWTIQEALRMRKSAYVFQHQFGMDRFRIGVNVEVSQLLKSDFADQVMLGLGEAGVSPNELVLEITEHALSEGEVALENLERLKKLGVWIAMDDFGTGYSNLSQIHHLPLSMLKLDKSFMPREGLSNIDKQLIIDIQSIAIGLGLNTLAEGVETQEVHDFIKLCGITYSQGYLYSPALAEIDFWNWVREHKHHTAS